MRLCLFGRRYAIGCVSVGSGECSCSGRMGGLGRGEEGEGKEGRARGGEPKPEGVAGGSA